MAIADLVIGDWGFVIVGAVSAIVASQSPIANRQLSQSPIANRQLSQSPIANRQSPMPL